MASNRRRVQRPDVATQGRIRECRLVLFGEAGVGKSSLALNFVSKVFNEYKKNTVGVEYLNQTVRLDDTTVRFQIWDTAGSEQYYAIAPLYYRDAKAGIVVYDITARHTYNRAKKWVEELQQQTSNDIVIALAANKADLTDWRAVETAEVQAYAEGNGLLFMETSAKTAMNVNHMFVAIAEQLMKRDETSGSIGSGQGSRGIVLSADRQQSSGCCCGCRRK